MTEFPYLVGWEALPEGDLGPSSLISSFVPLRVGEAAFHGLAGAYVRLLEPETEADPSAMLIEFLVLVGNMIGRTAHVRVGGAFHYANLFVVTVGGSGAAGRKGTGVTEALRLPALVEPSWARGRVKSGVVSGEGLIWQVRDPIYKRERLTKGGQYVEVETDPGVSDKRLVVRASEFSQILRVCGRDSNTTSSTLREAWDSGLELSTLAKNSPATATAPHVSMVGDITPVELKRELTDTEQANGFGNRILWCVSQRSKELPDGGALRDEDLFPLVDRLHRVLAFSRQMGQVERDAAASALWNGGIYHDLTRTREGLLAALLARAEAQVCRLALIYAALDESHTVTADHLRAAVAVWDYVERSTGVVFGGGSGNKVADTIEAALRRAPDGLTRTDISGVFSGNRTKDEIDRALADLAERGVAVKAIETTRGRPTERWSYRDEVRKKEKGSE